MSVDKFGRNAGSAAAGAATQFSTAGLVHKTGDIMAEILSIGGFRVTDVGTPTAGMDAQPRAMQIILTNIIYNSLAVR
jgi:hypothetical protein